MDVSQLATFGIFMIVTGLQGSTGQLQTVGPSNVEYINQSQSVTFNCSVTWTSDPTDSVVWGKYEGGGWKHLAQFYSTGYVQWVQMYKPKCMIESDPPYNYSQLTVISASLEDSGLYDCYPFSHGTPAEPHARLTVLDKIDTVQFTGQASSVAVLTVNEGQEYQLTCEGIAGNPPAELTWTLGNDDVTYNSTNTSRQHSDAILFDSSSTLWYTFDIADDNSVLTCTAFQYESLPVKTASLRLNVVEFSTDTTVVGPSNVEHLNASDSTTFSCNVTWGSNSEDFVVWAKRVYNVWQQICQFNRNNVTKWVEQFRSAYDLVESDVNVYELHVNNATLDEDAEYDCYPYAHSAPAQPHARLYVLDEIDSIVIDGNTSGSVVPVIAGQSYQFTCTAEAGSPAANLRWAVGNKIVKHVRSTTTSQSAVHPGLRDSQSVLEYVFTPAENSRNLSCHSNQYEDLGSYSASVTLDVLYEPIIHNITVVSWTNDHSVTLECNASANPDEVMYEWSVEGAETGANTRWWKLKDENADGVMTVTCNVTNDVGWTVLTLEVKDPDPIPCDSDCVRGVIVGCVLSGCMTILFICWICVYRRKHKTSK